MEASSSYPARSCARLSRGNGANPKQEDIDGASAPSPSRRPRKKYQNVSDIQYTPERALREGLKMVKEVKESLSKLTINNPTREGRWNKEIADLEAAKKDKPMTLIAVCGATGAGKSSILNAVLGDNIVPTSGMRACTSVVTKISYHRSREIRADISFLTQAEWRQELDALMGDWASHVDEAKLVGKAKAGDIRSEEAKIAWDKVRAVYPDLEAEDLDNMTAQELMDYDPRVTAMLGQVESVSASNSVEFGQKIARYIDSVSRDETSTVDNGTEDGKLSLWPLIREVHVYCKAKALSTGAVLVDLPGVADANAARANIAKEYLKQAKYIWILAPITRAVDDQTAQKLLGDAFQRQLLMDGNYDSSCITFIASKTDDVSCSEIVRALKLGNDPLYKAIQNRIKDIKRRANQVEQKKNGLSQRIKEAADHFDALKQSRHDTQARLDTLESGTMSWTTLPSASSSQRVGIKRKVKQPCPGKPGTSKVRRREKSESVDTSGSSSHSDSDSSSLDELEFSGDDVDTEYEEVTPDLGDVCDPALLRKRIQDLDKEIEAVQLQLDAEIAEAKRVMDENSTVEKELSLAQRDKNAFCAQKRNEFSKEILKEDFRIGLRKLEETEAERRDGAAFDPTQNTRDYSAIDLQVFTCSSRDYMRLQGQVEGDGAASCFASVEETEIPAVQRWCDVLTLPSRQQFSKKFLTQLFTLVNGAQLYVQHVQVTGDAAAAHRTLLSDRWDTHRARAYGRVGITRRLRKRFSELATKCADDLDKCFKEKIEEKCREGAKAASESAIDIIEKFGAIHHATYRATMKRYGSWRRDINFELVDPFTRTIAQSFSSMFETDLFGPFEVSIVNSVAQLLKEFEDSAADELKNGARLQGKACRVETRAALKRTMEAVKDTMISQRKEISRSVAPHIQKTLTESYENARREKGKGCVARIKTNFHNCVQMKKDAMFEEAADTILAGLNNAAEAVGSTLKDTLSDLAEKVEVNLAVIWEDVRSGKGEIVARANCLEVMSRIKSQTNLWLEAARIDEGGCDAFKVENEDPTRFPF